MSSDSSDSSCCGGMYGAGGSGGFGISITVPSGKLFSSSGLYLLLAMQKFQCLFLTFLKKKLKANLNTKDRVITCIQSDLNLIL